MADIKDKLIMLKNIKPDFEKKAAFRYVLIREIGKEIGIREYVGWLAFFFAKLKSVAVFLLFLAVLATSGGIAAASAAQDAIPGDTLYPLKITLEKIETAVVRDEAKKAELRLKFASRRLDEAEQLAEKETGNADSAVIKNLLDNYQKEIAESENIIQKKSVEKPEVADLLEKETETNKNTIITISKKMETRTQKSKSDEEKISKTLKEASERTETANDTASIIMFTDTKKITKDKIGYEKNKKITKKSGDKLKAAENKITETKKQIEQLKEDGYDTENAEKRLEEAANMFKNAETAIEKEIYRESLLQSIQARQKAKEAEELAEKAERKKDREEKSLERHNGNDDGN